MKPTPSQTAITTIKESISTHNIATDSRDQNNIIVMFQYITMTFIVALTSAIMITLYLDISNNLKFQTPTSTISIPVIKKSPPIEQILESFYVINNKFEKSLFIEDYSDIEKYPNVTNQIEKWIKLKELEKITTPRTKELFKSQGFARKINGRALRTPHVYEAVIETKNISKNSSITLQSNYYIYEITLDRSNLVSSIQQTNNKVLLAKNKYMDFISKLNKKTIISAIGLNSSISAISLSKMKMENIKFGKIRMAKNLSGDAVANFNIFIDNLTFEVMLKRDITGKIVITLS